MYAVVNRLRIQPGHGDEMERVFGHRGGVERQSGFKSFELWKLEEEADHEEYLVVTRWDSKDAFESWTQSDSFRQAHSGEPPAFILGPGQISKFDVRLSQSE